MKMSKPKTLIPGSNEMDSRISNEMDCRMIVNDTSWLHAAAPPHEEEQWGGGETMVCKQDNKLEYIKLVTLSTYHRLYDAAPWYEEEQRGWKTGHHPGLAGSWYRPRCSGLGR